MDRLSCHQAFQGILDCAYLVRLDIQLQCEKWLQSGGFFGTLLVNHRPRMAIEKKKDVRGHSLSLFKINQQIRNKHSNKFIQYHSQKTRENRKAKTTQNFIKNSSEEYLLATDQYMFPLAQMFSTSKLLPCTPEYNVAPVNKSDPQRASTKCHSLY